MAAELEMEDEELYETVDETEDDEAEDDEAEDDESAIAMYRPFPRPLTPSVPFGAGRFSGPGIVSRREEKRMRGVRAALIRGAGGASAIVRLPTAVATASGVRHLRRRSAQAESVLVDHERQLRLRRMAERNTRNTITGAIALQHLRDIATEARSTARVEVAANRWNAAVEPVLATADYTLSVGQTWAAVAAIPASQRSWLHSSLPFTSGLLTSLARETLRPPLGLGVAAAAGAAGKPFWRESALAVAVPALAGAAASYFVRPRRPPRRYVRM